MSYKFVDLEKKKYDLIVKMDDDIRSDFNRVNGSIGNTEASQKQQLLLKALKVLALLTQHQAQVKLKLPKIMYKSNYKLYKTNTINIKINLKHLIG